MSQTESLGVADASRWVGVAASLVDFLRSWLDAPQGPPPVPAGIFAGARRFLKQALEGIALDRRERLQPHVPIMAGITNLTIAIGVSRRLTPPGGDLEHLEGTLHSYLDCLDAIETSQPRTELLLQYARSLKEFFQELQDQGNRARHSAHARAESPQP